MILCCGEALIDMLPAVTRTEKSGYVPHTGGAVFNTAIALGRLNIPTGMLTGLSTDLHGRLLEAELQDAGVDTSLTIRSNRPTTLAFVELSGGEASYTFYDENSAGRMVTPADIPELSPDISALFAGGISLVVEPAADAYAALVDREKGRRPIMVDPNIRPGFVRDEDRYRARLARVIGCCDILKISDADLDWLVPGPQTTIEKTAAVSGPSVVIVTEGGHGSTAILADGRSVTVPALDVAVVDTVGAGDTFNAGILAQLFDSGLLTVGALRSLGRADIRRAMTFAHKVAAITVSREGADPPWRSEIDV